MTPRDRALATLRGERADRVPLHLEGFEFANRQALADCPDPRRRAVAERIYDETAYIHSVPSQVNRFLVTPPQMISSADEPVPGGGTRTVGHIDTPSGPLTFGRQFDVAANTSWQTEYPVKSRADIAAIAAVPWELPPGLEPPDVGALPPDEEGRRIVAARISSPFVCVAGMMPFELFLELCAADMDLLRELTDTCRKRILEVLQVLLSGPGIDYVWIGGSEWVTPPMASPRIYDALVQEQERSLIECVREHGDAVVHVHCHGHVRHALSRTIERGADYAEPMEPPPDGDISMAEAKVLAAGRITLGGNVECRVLCNESDEEAERATRAAFEGGKDRFVLSATAGPSPRMAENEERNYHRLVDVWEELSPIG